MNGKVNWDHALTAAGGSPELLREIIDIFFEECPKLLVGIQSSIEAEAFVELRRFAHTLRGTLRYFGDMPASRLAHELEDMGREKQIERASGVFIPLQVEMDAVCSELRDFVATHSPKTDA